MNCDVLEAWLLICLLEEEQGFEFFGYTRNFFGGSDLHLVAACFKFKPAKIIILFSKHQKTDFRTLDPAVSKSYPRTDLATDFGAGEEKIMRSNVEFTNQALEESVLMSTAGDIRCSNMSTTGALIRNEKS